MKLLVYGRDIVIQRIKAVLYKSGIEVYEISWDSLSSRENGKHYDLAIVDMSAEKAEIACRIIGKTHNIPLILIIKQGQTDWAYLDSLNAAGFIPDTFSKNELIARLNAITRRNKANQTDYSETIRAS